MVARPEGAPCRPREQPPAQASARLKKLLKNLGAGELGAGAGCHTRFEFSMLPADGGSVMPHTESPGKIVTLVVSMVRRGRVGSGLGGGTDVNRPKDVRLAFNG